MKYQFSNHGCQPTVCSRTEVGSGEACSRRNDRKCYLLHFHSSLMRVSGILGSTVVSRILATQSDHITDCEGEGKGEGKG
mgnify:CR=1 FL=1